MLNAHQGELVAPPRQRASHFSLAARQEYASTFLPVRLRHRTLAVLV